MKWAIIAVLAVTLGGIGVKAKQNYGNGEIISGNASTLNAPSNYDLRSPPQPVWVPDPSAGHYDCPGGWTAYSRSEPYAVRWTGELWSDGLGTLMDAKGHILKLRPDPGICVEDKK